MRTRTPFDMRGIGRLVEPVMPTPATGHGTAAYVYAYSLTTGDRVHMPGGVGTVTHKHTQGQSIMLSIDQYQCTPYGYTNKTWQLKTTPLSLWQLEE